MSSNHHAESRFVELMTELFQLDEAESLDFGIYRIIRRHNREVRDFLGEIVVEREQKSLKGGLLSEILETTFSSADAEASADDKYRLIQLEKDLSIKAGMSPAERESQLVTLEKISATANMVAEYRSRLEQKNSASTAAGDRTEVLNRLYQFFARHYQDGDFIVERRYGRDGSRYVRSTGEDTEFHWATEDMYYIKSGDTFTDFPVQLSRGQRLLFTVEPESLHKTRAELKPSDKAHYELDAVTKDAEGAFRVSLNYLKGGQSDKQKDEIAAAVEKASGGDSAEIKRWLNHLIARNQSDFFIHKRLKEALSEDLDIFIKIEIMDADQLLTAGDLPRRIIKVARIVREVGRRIIDFLAALEDFQKALWEKKKLVFETRYVITLDRLEKLAGREWLERHLEQIVAAQREEWRALGLGDSATPAACRVEIPGDLLTAARTRYLPLPVDTGNFDEDFKWQLLESVTRNNSLDEALDGVAIHSDNWQALNTLQQKYREQIKCVYIDPPYNTNSSGIPYKNGYRHSSWGALMHNRLGMLHTVLTPDGAIFVSIDKAERSQLEQLLDSTFGTDNRIEELIWAMNTNNSQAPNYSTNHEYIEVYAKNRLTVEQDRNMFREPKPGFEEVMELVGRLNPAFPSIAAIEAEIKGLYEQHKMGFRQQVEDQGLDWEEEKSNDPWRGLFNYSRAEYRDSIGSFVAESEAKAKQALIWIWREDNVAMPATKQAESTNDPNHRNWRFYNPLHPKTAKPCTHPKSGWKFAYADDDGSPDKRSFVSLDKDHRIAWGENEAKVPQIKRMLHEVETNVGKSVFRDYSDGEKQTSAMFGKSGLFLAPKHADFVSRFIIQGSKANSTVLDCFGGSGSTAHAVMTVNRLEKTRRKFITIEVNKYFNTLIVPRFKKVGAANVWGAGKAKTLDGPGLFMRVQNLEQYEDTLENLDTDIEQQKELPFDDPAFALRYRLDRTTRQVFSSIASFTSPFGYQLKRSAGSGAAQSQQVDLTESLIYLLGLDVTRLYREPQGVVITGHDRRGRTVAVFFRDCAPLSPGPSPDGRGEDCSAAWAEAKLAEHPAERILTNDPASLTFEGCERFEAIESVFAGQFGRV